MRRWLNHFSAVAAAFAFVLWCLHLGILRAGPRGGLLGLVAAFWIGVILTWLTTPIPAEKVGREGK